MVQQCETCGIQVVKKTNTQIDAETEMVWCGVAVGYADKAAPINSWRTERAPLEGFATFLSAKL